MDFSGAPESQSMITINLYIIIYHKKEDLYFFQYIFIPFVTLLSHDIMGLLTVGKPLSFPESKRYILYVRDHGIIQFLHTWERVKGIQNDELKWGDEIEVGVFVVDHERTTIKISLRGAEVSILISRSSRYTHH